MKSWSTLPRAFVIIVFLVEVAGWFFLYSEIFGYEFWVHSFEVLERLVREEAQRELEALPDLVFVDQGVESKFAFAAGFASFFGEFE